MASTVAWRFDSDRRFAVHCDNALIRKKKMAWPGNAKSRHEADFCKNGG